MANTTQGAKSSGTHSNSSPSTAQQVATQLSATCTAEREDFQTLVDEVGSSVTSYCRKRPMVAGLTIFALGFYVGWKIKPW